MLSVRRISCSYYAIFWLVHLRNPLVESWMARKCLHCRVTGPMGEKMTGGDFRTRPISTGERAPVLFNNFFLRKPGCVDSLSFSKPWLIRARSVFKGDVFLKSIKSSRLRCSQADLQDPLCLVTRCFFFFFEQAMLHCAKQNCQNNRP